MYCRAIACDFDGTGAADGRLAPEVATALHAARDRGIATLLVTGRVLEDLRLALIDFGAFDAVVAENGAVLWLPESDRFLQLAPSPPDAFLGLLHAAGIPFHVGSVVIGTWEGHAQEALALIRQAGLDLQISFNRAAVMLLPSGVNKATGVRRALAELRLSAHNLVAFGDAENDLPLFALAELAVAARGSRPAIAAAADESLAQPGAAGVAHYVARLLERGATAPTPERHAVHLGRSSDGKDALLPADAGHVVVCGDPRSGKSWVAGMLAERLLETDHRLCVVDPEGDHLSLAQRPHVIALGGALALPAAADVATLIRDTGASLVLNLAALSQERKGDYVCRLLAGIADQQRASGVPHWTFVDEAHYFFCDRRPCCAGALQRTGNAVLITYRPSALDPSAHDAAAAHVITRTADDAERYFLSQLIGSRGPAGRTPSELLDEIVEGRLGLLLRTPSAPPSWRIFVPASRLTLHGHHRRKYLDTDLPPDKAFRFCEPRGAVIALARNVRQFADAMGNVSHACLAGHLAAHDFSRWAHEVLGDRRLASSFAEIEDRALDVPIARRDLLAQIRDRYAT